MLIFGQVYFGHCLRLLALPQLSYVNPSDWCNWLPACLSAASSSTRLWLWCQKYKHQAINHVDPLLLFRYFLASQVYKWPYNTILSCGSTIWVHGIITSSSQRNVNWCHSTKVTRALMCRRDPLWSSLSSSSADGSHQAQQWDQSSFTQKQFKWTIETVKG